MYLLGARRVIAVDFQQVAQPTVISQAVGESVANIVSTTLSPFEDRGSIRARLGRLQQVKRFNLEALADLGVEYMAPLDLAVEYVGTPIDFVYSNAVLEHIPREDLRPVLEHLVRDLTPGGKMINMVHLEDHRDLTAAPFEFLSESATSFGRQMQMVRGNRVRQSEWKTILSSIPGIDYSFFLEWTRDDCPLPKRIDPSITFTDERDLRVSHLGIMITKRV
jgi:SAM-dependent methyltransferase